MTECWCAGGDCERVLLGESTLPPPSPPPPPPPPFCPFWLWEACPASGAFTLIFSRSSRLLINSLVTALLPPNLAGALAFSCCLGNRILLPKRLDRTIRLTISLHGRSSKGGFSLRRHFDRLLLKTRFQIRSRKTSRFLMFCLNSCHVYEWPQSLFCCSTPVNNSLQHSMVLDSETKFRKCSEFSINRIHFFHSFTQPW